MFISKIMFLKKKTKQNFKVNKNKPMMELRNTFRAPKRKSRTCVKISGKK